MDPSSKRLIREQTLDNDGEDLISNLPDSVLAHILSKLPTKYAVGTAILSTKWKHLFSLIPQPDIDLDDSLIIHSQHNSDSDLQRRLDSFEDFNNRVLDKLLKEVPSIRKFTLKCNEEYGYNQFDVLDWITAAVHCSVVILDISAPLGDLVNCLFLLISGSENLLNFVFSHSTFSGPGSAALFNSILSPSPEYPPFLVPNLRYIHFDNVTLLDGEAIPLLLSGCPMLYSLTLSNCPLFELEVLNISSHSLVQLSIESCFCNRYSTCTNNFVLNTPALEKFCFSDTVMLNFEFENLDSVEVAEINVVAVEGMDDEDTLAYHQFATEFVGEFFNVEHLCLSKDTISDLQKSGEEIPVFSNLTVLHLGGFDTNGWKLLPRLLKNAPNLEHLCILEKFHEEEGCYEVFKSHWSDTFPACLLSTVERIEIFGFQGEVDERRLITYFLALGKNVLKKFDITCDMSSHMVQSFKLCVESLPELKETCEIIFHNE